MPVSSATMRRIRRHIGNLASGDIRTSGHAEGCLIRFYGARALERLVEACDHPDSKVRVHAVWALGHTRDPRAFETILRLTDDPDERVRYDATIALGILGDDRAIEPLIRIEFANDPDRPACEGLYRMGPRVVPVLARLLREGNASTRWSVTQVAGNFAQELADEASISLLEMCLSDDDASVRENADYWLKEIPS